MTSTPEAIAEFFGFKVNFQFEPRYNIAPGQSILAMRQKDDRLEPVILRWGLIPSWTKDPSIGYKMINARSETVAEKPSFRSAYKSRRCLIPVDGFYEWKREGKQKRPYYFHRSDNQWFCFAGLWERWADKSTGVTIESCTIITTAANAMMTPIHHRMPVVVQPKRFNQWMSGDTGDEVLPPNEWPGFECYPVSTYVNNARNEGLECVTRIEGGL